MQLLPENTIPYLRDRFRLADAILFTGAGFARGMYNSLNKPMPLGKDLKPLLWELSFPSEAYDDTSSLQDLFDYARSRRPAALREMLEKHLTIDAPSIPAYYADLFSLPWHRIYTLNVDTFADAVSRQYMVSRKPLILSALRRERIVSQDPSKFIEYVHLNGILADGPNGMTFSTTQFSERLVGQDPLYAQCAADILARPVIFIGTPLDESPLWQHIVMRRRGAAAGSEFRRKSFIVTPKLDRARRELLEREFNVHLIPMTTEEFTSAILTEVADAAREGLSLLKTTTESEQIRLVPHVAELVRGEPAVSTEFLLGQSPTWSDIQNGRAAVRQVDSELEVSVTAILGNDEQLRGVLLLTGTAGAGKSTTSKRLALRLTAQGYDVGWVDSDIDIAPYDIRRSLEQQPRMSVLIIDDADQYGTSTADIVAEIVKLSSHPLVILGIRSGRVDRIVDRLAVLGVPVLEKVMPHLADPDIDGILEVLDRENRLGVLKGLSHSDQVKAFRENAGRQLLVAMLEATSGRRFEERIREEMDGLEQESRAVYGLVAIGTAVRFSVTRDEVLLAVREATNATLVALDNLQRRNLILTNPNGQLRVRHRVIAEVLLDSMAEDGSLESAVTRLAIASGTKVGPNSKRSGSHYRRMRTLMNHDWLSRHVGAPAAKRVYSELEPLMHWDYHYWLQRGTLELEVGDIQLAENFLNQAYSLEAFDPIVQTEYGLLQLRFAIDTPNGEEARRLFAEGTALLRSAISARSGSDPHQYHIYGRQGLMWLNRGDVTQRERELLLDEISEIVSAGRKAHPRDERLRVLYVEIQNTKLGKAKHQKARRSKRKRTPKSLGRPLSARLDDNESRSDITPETAPKSAKPDFPPLDEKVSAVQDSVDGRTRRRRRCRRTPKKGR